MVELKDRAHLDIKSDITIKLKDGTFMGRFSNNSRGYSGKINGVINKLLEKDLIEPYEAQGMRRDLIRSSKNYISIDPMLKVYDEMREISSFFFGFVLPVLLFKDTNSESFSP